MKRLVDIGRVLNNYREEQEKPDKAFASGEKGIGYVAQSMDGTLAAVFFPNFLQGLKSFSLFWSHLAPANECLVGEAR